MKEIHKKCHISKSIIEKLKKWPKKIQKNKIQNNKKKNRMSL